MKWSLCVVVCLITYIGCRQKATHVESSNPGDTSAISTGKASALNIGQSASKPDSFQKYDGATFFCEPDTIDSDGRIFSEIMAEKVGNYDGAHKVREGLYLVRKSNVGRVFKGLYFVNLSTERVDKIIGGEIGAVYNFTSGNSTKWMLVKSADLNNGILREYLNGIVFSSNDSDDVVATVLEQSIEDGESGGCGDKKIEEAASLDSVSVRDRDNDGNLDVAIYKTDLICNTNASKKSCIVYCVVNDSFVRK
jgi:hypothetical protein